MSDKPRSRSKPPTSTPDTDSLVKRLAGPSTGKAGLAKDQTEINRIIAEASKGSKFYGNEKRKDRELTERIAQILKHRDEVLKGVDIRKIEQGVDQLLADLESHRDLTQTIVHVDMDAFYASVELLDNPDLAGKPFAVGRGVLTTASYEARKYGARSGMPTFIASKLCPNLVIVSNHFQRYMEMSKKVMDIFRRYDPNMCAAGCDEGYLNITAYCDEHCLTADDCVLQMREAVFNETKLTVSAGIAPNKMLAKICSDRNKPNGQFKLEFDATAIKAFMRDLSIRKVPGVGRVNERLLDSIGIQTCGDIFEHRGVLSLMDRQFGLHFLLQAYLGLASNVVAPSQREERKSIGAERTFTPLSDQGKILAKLEEIAAELEDDMTSGGWTGKTITLKYKLDTYQVFTRARSFTKWISTTKEDLLAIGKEILMPELPLTLRLIGLRVTKLKDLRANPDDNPNSIKRFFGAAPASTSPCKKRRLDVEADGGEEYQLLSQDVYEDAMPGYHEHAEAEEDARALREPAQPAGEEDDDPEIVLLETQPGERSAHSPSKKVSSAKPKSSKSPNTKIRGSERPQVCPICARTVEGDNRALNAHIDFCLSKEVIMEAQSSAAVETRRKPSSSSTKAAAGASRKRKA